MNEGLRQLMDFISRHEDLEGGRSFFRHLDQFLSRAFGRTRLLVYSIPKERFRPPGESAPRPRLLWNTGDDEETQCAWADPPVGEESWRDLGAGLYRLGMGERDGQILYAIVSCVRPLGRDVLDLLANFLVAQGRRSCRVAEIRRMESLIYIDDLTGLFNQRKLFLDLDEVIQAHERHGDGFAVLFIDIDDFKEVNDTHGHLMGSRVLAQMGAVIKGVVREEDSLYRYGGDEFVVLLKDAIPGAAASLRRRLIETVADKEFGREGDKIALQISVGAAHYPQDAASRDDILNLADQMMYADKRA